MALPPTRESVPVSYQSVNSGHTPDANALSCVHRRVGMERICLPSSVPERKSKREAKKTSGPRKTSKDLNRGSAKMLPAKKSWVCHTGTQLFSRIQGYP